MRPTLMIAAALAMVSGTAVAQMTPQTNPTTQPPPMDNNASSDATQTAPPKPSTWQGTDEEWARHARMCQQRHSGYDPATDQYRDDHGAMKTCPR